MIDKTREVVERYEALTELLASPEIASNPSRYSEIAKERHELEAVVEKGGAYLKLMDQIAEDRTILQGDDEELKSIVREELSALEEQRLCLEESLKLLLLPKDPRDDKNTIMEIRAGTGGDEAALFAADLFRMYSRYAERKLWKTGVLSSNEIGGGGFKEVIFSLEGESVFGELKYEGGVHRVQRVPETEASGRIHTSAATVAVLPEADEIDVGIDPRDLRIDTFRASRRRAACKQD